MALSPTLTQLDFLERIHGHDKLQKLEEIAFKLKENIQHNRKKILTNCILKMINFEAT